MFQFKCASLLRFDEAARDQDDSVLIGNLERLYQLDAVASDTQMRQILDAVPPDALRPAFRAVISECQRGGVLEDFKCLDDRLLVSIDGTGLFSSTKVHCPHCGVRKQRRGSSKIEYYHQMLVSAIVSPNVKTVLALDFEPIVQSDGDTKDLSERNSARRLVASIAEQYPKLKQRFVIVEDALAANGPHVELLCEHGLDFIIGVRLPGSAFLFSAFDERRDTPGAVSEIESTDDKGVVRGCRFANDLPLNARHHEVRVNFIEFWEIDTKGVEHNWSWITSLEITADNALEIARAGRARWRIENETFNTLKNQGYNLEHNYGHGKRYLSSTLAGLMLLAFLTDQVQEHACRLYQTARTKARVKADLWARMLTYLHEVELPDWEILWRLIGHTGPKLIIDSS